MSSRALLVTCTAALAGCGGNDAFLIVTVEGRPAVHDVTALQITLANGGSMRTDELSLDGATFPVTFSISAPDRAGPLDISIDALDADGLTVGRGAVASDLGAYDATVRLLPTDFVINTDVADDQFPSDDYEAHGSQVAAAPDGTWTAVYRGACIAPCDMFARRFDATGRAVSSQLAAGTNGFAVTTSATEAVATPAVASTGTKTLVVWDYAQSTPANVEGIACRALDAQGAGNPTQISIANDPSSDVVSIAPLSNDNFAVAWSAFLTPNVVIRSVVVTPDCTPLSSPSTVSTVLPTGSARKVSVASNAGTTLYAWIVDGAVRVRIANNANVYQSTDTEFLPRGVTEEVDYVRVAPLASGFAVVVRWAAVTGSAAPGRLELYRTNPMGAVLGAAVPISTKSTNDFVTSQGFGVATNRAGVLMVTWHACDANGDGSGCGAWGRAFNADGTPRGPEALVPTTLTGDQTGPSVAALDDAFVVVWRDASGAAPDTSGTAARARIVYPD